MLTDRDKILSALREKPHKVFEVMKRANISNQEACKCGRHGHDADHYRNKNRAPKRRLRLGCR
jgi:hypothetical protein